MSWYPGILYRFLFGSVSGDTDKLYHPLIEFSIVFRNKQTWKANGSFSFSLRLLSLTHFLGPDPYSFLHCDSNFNVF